LNGKPNAMSRADSAMNTFVDNRLSGMASTGKLGYSREFYKTLPPANVLPSAGTVAATDADAHFVRVVVTPVTVSTTFSATYLIPGGSNTFSAGAQAVAGYGPEAVCDIPPVFICNPWEGTGTSLSAALADRAQRQRQLKILNDGTIGPGHFGWLVPPDGDASASNLRDWISRTKPKTCYSTTGVDLNTGAKESALEGLNVRFDIGTSMDHDPDTNVRKGYVAPSSGSNWCNSSIDNNAAVPALDSTRSMALPQDTSFSNLVGSGKWGNGEWDCGTYWDFNHSESKTTHYPRPAVQANGSPGICGTSTTTTLSRYDIYAYENIKDLSKGGRGDWSRGKKPPENYNNPPSATYNNDMGESGKPLCAGVKGVANRRLLYVAVINCTANAAAMAAGGSNATNIPVEGYAKFFMTETVPTTGGASGRTLTGEFTGVLTNLDTPHRVTVQLYR